MEQLIVRGNHTEDKGAIVSRIASRKVNIIIDYKLVPKAGTEKIAKLVLMMSTGLRPNLSAKEPM
jgi:hypothetical protein